jgi:hypothetical protein
VAGDIAENDLKAFGEVNDFSVTFRIAENRLNAQAITSRQRLDLAGYVIAFQCIFVDVLVWFLRREVRIFSHRHI